MTTMNKDDYRHTKQYKKDIENVLNDIEKEALRAAKKINLNPQECVEIFYQSAINPSEDYYKMRNWRQISLIGFILAVVDDIASRGYDIEDTMPSKKRRTPFKGTFGSLFHLGYTLALIDSLTDKSEDMRRYAKIGIEKTPIFHAKRKIAEHYEANKTQFKRRGYSAQFIREMWEKYPEIQSIKTVEKLVSNLNKTNHEIPR